MGISDMEYELGSTTSHPEIANKSKKPDDYFYPRPRKMTNGDAMAWSTFVTEAGVSESLPRLRQDAGWWFANLGRLEFFWWSP